MLEIGSRLEPLKYSVQCPSAWGHVPALTILTPIHGQIDKGANPKRKSSGVELQSRFDGNHTIILAAPAASLVPNVLLSNPLDNTSETAKGVMTTGQPRISSHLAKFAPWRRYSNSTDVGNGQYGLPPTV